MSYTDRALAFLAARGSYPPVPEPPRESSERGEGSNDRDVTDGRARASNPDAVHDGASTRRHQQATSYSPQTNADDRSVVITTHAELEAALPALASAAMLGFDPETAGQGS